MDAKHLNPALDSITNVLTTMAGITPTIGKPSIKSDQNAPGIITGVIDMISDKTTGSLAISFSKPVALKLANKMLQSDINDVDETIKDLVGEMTNMMAGGAKAIYQEQGYDFKMTQPKVIAGENHQVKHSI